MDDRAVQSISGQDNRSYQTKSSNQCQRLQRLPAQKPKGKQSVWGYGSANSGNVDFVNEYTTCTNPRDVRESAVHMLLFTVIDRWERLIAEYVRKISTVTFKFINLMTGYDSIDHSELWNIMVENGRMCSSSFWTSTRRWNLMPTFQHRPRSRRLWLQESWEQW